MGKKVEYSFAQYITDNFGDKYLDKIWDESNSVNPFEISYKANKECKFKCIKNNNHTYSRKLYVYCKTQNCPICEREKQSIGIKYPECVDLWSESNILTPLDYSSQSGDSVIWKCNNGIHDDYKRTIKNSVKMHFECPQCKNKLPHPNTWNRLDLTGQVFGELTVDSFSHTKNSTTFWNCTCSCGEKVIKNGNDMKAGKIITCGNRSIHRLGENNSNWRNGATEKNYSERYSEKYSEWHNESLKLDNYTCQCCGQYSGDLEVHHIYDFATYEDLRTDIVNGIVLCKSCHNSTVDGSFHNLYGTIGKTPSELEEYINNKRKQLGIDVPFSIDEYINNKVLNSKQNMWAFNTKKQCNKHIHIKYIHQGFKRRK